MVVLPLGVYLAVNITHVAAHLLATRLLGIRIDRLSLGVGPTLWQGAWRGTTVRLALLPVGFLVRLTPPAEKGAAAPAIQRADFRGASALARLTVILAPLLALLLLSWGAAFHMHNVGVFRGGTPYLGAVHKDSPAEAAGLRPADLVERINGKRIARWDELLKALKDAQGRPSRLVVRRGTKTLELTVKPRKLDKRWLIGVQVGRQLMRVEGLGRRAQVAFGSVFSAMSETLGGAKMMIFGRHTSTLGGPIEIFEQPKSDRAQAEASQRAAAIAGTFAFYLLICLLPLPYLDGRRLLFWLIGLAARAPLHPRWEQGYNRWGLVVVVLLHVLLFAPDLLRLLS